MAMAQKIPTMVIVIAFLFAGVIGVSLLINYQRAAIKKVTNYEECIAAGYKISENYIYPPRCTSPEGQVFARESPPAEPPASGNTGLANPASVYCEDNGGTLEIRKDESGGAIGACVFSDGSECEEWAFYRGECGSVSKTPAKEAFCGESSYGKCTKNDDCVAGGCSSQICLSKNEQSDTVTTCEWADCYDATSYGLTCGCLNSKCQWTK